MNEYYSTIEAITKLLFIPKSIPNNADLCIVLGNDYIDTMVDVKWVFEQGICNKFILTGNSAKMEKEPEYERFLKEVLNLLYRRR